MHFDVPKAGPEPKTEWGSDVAAKVLRDLGFRYVSLNPGASYRGLHDSLVNYLGNTDPSILLCLHEDHVVGIAHGYAKVTGEPMACILHSNVGLMHGMMNMFNAWVDRVPMMVIGATGPVDANKRRPWVDWVHTAADQGGMVRDIVKFDNQPTSPEAMIEAFCRGHKLTRTKPHGPVYICLDAGLQESRIDHSIDWPQFSRIQPPRAPSAGGAALDEILELLGSAERPLLLFGRGDRSQTAWENRIALAERLGACVVTDLRTCAVFPTDHPAHVSPPMPSASVSDRDLISAADVIVAFEWPDLGGLTKPLAQAGGQRAKVVNVSLDHHLHNGAHMDHNQLAECDCSVSACPDMTVVALLERLPAQHTAPWSKSRIPTRKINASRLTVPFVAQALREVVADPSDYAFSSICKDWPCDIWPIRDPLGYFGKDGGGGIGAGPSIAVGVALALQDTPRKTIAFLGDGDFIMGATALWTAVKYGIPLLVLINNNRSYFNDELHQESVAVTRDRPVENRSIGLSISGPEIDLAGLARVQGAIGIGPIKDTADVAAALKAGLAALDDGKVCLIDFHINPGAERSTSAVGQRRG